MLTYDAITGAGLVASIMAGAEATVPGDIFEIFPSTPWSLLPVAMFAVAFGVYYWFERLSGLRVRSRRRHRWDSGTQGSQDGGSD